MEKIIIKSSGEKEPFSTKKFQRSLRKAGASPDIIEKLTNEVVHNDSLKTTHDIYAYAFSKLREHRPAIAARYNLKKALSELGPHGYPFEHFVAALFKEQGYEVEVGVMVKGFCVDHEIDVCLAKNNQHFMVECKFHASHLKVNVKIPLYIKARFDDVERGHKEKETKDFFHQGWIVTNTKFTSEAITYAQCVDIQLLGWSYPIKDSLAHMIDDLGLHPVTALTSLSENQKNAIINEGLVLCRDTAQQRDLLKKVGLNDEKIDSIVQEATEMCELGAINND